MVLVRCVIHVSLFQGRFVFVRGWLRNKLWKRPQKDPLDLFRRDTPLSVCLVSGSRDTCTEPPFSSVFLQAGCSATA